MAHVTHTRTHSNKFWLFYFFLSRGCIYAVGEIENIAALAAAAAACYTAVIVVAAT